MRTPLSTLVGLSRVLLQQVFGELNPQQVGYLMSMHESGQHMEKLVSSILDLAKLDARRVDLDLQPVLIRDVYSQCLGFLQAQILAKNLNPCLFMETTFETLVADPLRLTQILLNLLSNAVKFTPVGGSIGLTVQDVINEHGVPCLHLIVWDTGIGIEPSQQLRLFQPYSQVSASQELKNQGTGLGLSIAWKLAVLHQGRILIDSELGEGARFTLEMPLDLT